MYLGINLLYIISNLIKRKDVENLYSLYDTYGWHGGVSHTYRKVNGQNSVRVYFERPSDEGFDTAEFRVPGYECIKFTGFNTGELEWLKELAGRNIPLIFKYAREASK